MNRNLYLSERSARFQRAEEGTRCRQDACATCSNRQHLPIRPGYEEPLAKPPSTRRGATLTLGVLGSWREKKLFFTAFLLAASVGGFCGATGFYNPDQSVSSQGQADAVVARPQDASTLYYNPAGIVHLSPWELTSGFHAVLFDLEHVTKDLSLSREARKEGQLLNSRRLGVLAREEAPRRKETATDTFFVPHVYFSANPPKSRFAAGMAINSPFGLGTDWGGQSFARYAAPYSKLDLMMINPNVAYRVTDGFSVAAGAELYTGEATFDRFVPSAMLPLGGPPGTDIGTSIKADGSAWGWNLALLYLLSDRVSFGASYRSKADLDLSGPLRTYPPVPLSIDSSLEMRLPSTLKAGLAFRATERLSLEFDIDWLEWSRFKNVEVSFSPPVVPTQVSPRDWDDIVLYSIGGQYVLGKGWKVRAGYGYAESPIPDATYEPGIPRNDVHVVSFGAGKTLGKISLDLACTFILSEKRDVDSAVGEPFFTVDGEYDSLLTVIGGGLSYRF